MLAHDAEVDGQAVPRHQHGAKFVSDSAPFRSLTIPSDDVGRFGVERAHSLQRSRQQRTAHDGAPDRHRYVLEQSSARPAGATYNYNSGFTIAESQMRASRPKTTSPMTWAVGATQTSSAID